MSVSPTQLKLAEASVMPTDFSTGPIGGAPTANIINGSSVGEAHFSMGSSMEGGGSKVQRSKLFYINESTTDDLTSAKIYIANALDTVAGNDEWRFVSDSADDDDSDDGITYRGIGFDTAGDPLQEEVVGNGTSEVLSLADFSVRGRVETRNNLSGELQPMAGNGTIKKGTSAIGAIPAGYYSATSEIDIWLPSTLDDTGEADDAGTDPDGLGTFTRPRTFAGGLAVANSGTLSAESGQGVWSRWTVPEEALPSGDIQVVLAIQGDTA